MFKNEQYFNIHIIEDGRTPTRNCNFSAWREGSIASMHTTPGRKMESPPYLMVENDAENDLKKRVALGILTKSHATLEIHRLARYALQSKSAQLLPRERVSKCLRNRISKDEPVKAMYNPNRKKAHYSNIQRCGSVWSCPVCAQIISEKRKNEVKQAIDAHLATGGGVYLCTLTIPHYMGDNLKEMLGGLQGATKRLFSGTRRSKEVWASLGKVGHIKALELTYGANGWHPHFHIIIFTKKRLLEGTPITSLIECWQNACRLAKLPIPSLFNGLDWRGADNAVSDYLNKWGIEHEVTKSHLKRGKESRTPWDMLRLSMIEDHPEAEKMEKLFQEFALSFKGKRQLVWSRGLKAMYRIGEKTDEELAEETEKSSIEIMDIHEMVWSLVLRYHRRSDLLHCIEYDQLYGSDKVNQLISMLVSFEINRLSLGGVGGVSFTDHRHTTPPKWYDNDVPDLDKPDWVLD